MQRTGSNRAACSLLTGIVAIGPASVPCFGTQPPTTDPTHLRELVGVHRAPLREGIQVSYRFWTSEMPASAKGEVETLAWSERGVRVEYGSPRAEAASYNAVSGVATRMYSDGLVEQALSPDAIGLGVASLQCEYVLGMYPTNDAGGRPGFTNDLMHLLGHSDSVILNESVEVDGFDCVVVDRVRRSADGGTRTMSRGYYAPILGFAQVKLEFFGPTGCVVSCWNSSGFIEPLEGGVAIPTRGEFHNFECTGETVSWVVVELESGPDGSPAVSIGESVIVDVHVPAGAQIHVVRSHDPAHSKVALGDADGAMGEEAQLPRPASDAATPRGQSRASVNTALLLFGGVAIAWGLRRRYLSSVRPAGAQVR